MTKVQEAYEERKKAIKSQLALLSRWADKEPSEIDWSHVGSLGHVLEELSDVTTFLNLY